MLMMVQVLRPDVVEQLQSFPECRCNLYECYVDVDVELDIELDGFGFWVQLGFWFCPPCEFPVVVGSRCVYCWYHGIPLHVINDDNDIVMSDISSE